MQNIFLKHRIKSNFSIFKRQKYSLLTIISDNGNNNKKKCLKICVGIFRVGIFQGEFDGWEFSGGGILEGGIWWVGIFRGEIFLEPYMNTVTNYTLFFYKQLQK